MWYAFWAVTLAFISLAIIWYAMYRENLEETGAAKGDPIRSSLKFLDSAATPADPTRASAAPKKSAASKSPAKTSNPPKSASKASPKKGPKK
jgi:hypothetical protein